MLFNRDNKIRYEFPIAHRTYLSTHLSKASSRNYPQRNFTKYATLKEAEFEFFVLASPHASNPHRRQKHFSRLPGLILNADTRRGLPGRADIPLIADSNEV